MKRANRSVLIMGIIMLCLILGSIILLSEMKVSIEVGTAIRPWAAETVACFLIVLGLLHLWGITGLILQFRHFKSASILRAIAFVIGILSLFFLAVDVAMLSDIGKEYPLQIDVSGEWRIVFIGHSVHGLFAALLTVQSALGLTKASRSKKTEGAMKDEVLFLTVQQVGVISALLGLVCLFALSRAGIPQMYLEGLLFLSCIVVFIPYGLAAAFWLFTKRKEKITDWYDEKQFSDLSLGALISLIVTVLLAIIIYALASFKIMEVTAAFWFPFYLLITLLIFSGSILCRSSR